MIRLKDGKYFVKRLFKGKKKDLLNQGGEKHRIIAADKKFIHQFVQVNITNVANPHRLVGEIINAAS